MIKQVDKLEDVIAVRRHNADHAVFSDLDAFFRP
jgi:acetolactate synthase-1/3 small subunit